MALTNSKTGEYLKVYRVTWEVVSHRLNVQYLLFASAEQRRRYEQGLSPYETYVLGNYDCEMDLVVLSDKMLKDSLLTTCYEALKMDVFQGWEDA